MTILLGLAHHLFAQMTTNTGEQTPDSMVAQGKIYVVMFVCLVILGGLITYLILLDRKIKRLEKQKD
jgi:hypothetical protein